MATPEVATAVRQDDLRLADPLWLWQMAEGAKRVLQGVLGSMIAGLVLGGLAAVAEGLLRASDLALGLLGLLLPMEIGLGLLAVSGLWSLTAAEPWRVARRQGLSAGMLTRAAMAALIVVAVVSSPVSRLAVSEREGSYLITACVWGMLTSLTACVAWRMRRAGGTGWVATAQALAWGFALTPAAAGLFAVLLLDDWEAVALVTLSLIWGLLLIILLVVLGRARDVFARAAEEAWALRTPPAELQLDEQGHIAMDVPCRGCGYNLRGLEPGVGCPECGAASRPSIEVHLVRAKDPIWPGAVATGMTWLLVTLAAGLALTLTMRVLPLVVSSQGRPTSGAIRWYWLISLAGSLLGFGTLVGIWKITTPTLGCRQATGERTRKAARFCLWLRVVLTLRVPGPFLGSSALLAYAGLFGSSLLGLIGWVALLRHCRHLAERAGEALLAEYTRRSTRQVAWLLGLSLALTVWMNFENFRLNLARAAGSGAMPANPSPWDALREVLSWVAFGLYAAFVIVMIRLAQAYRKRFRLIAQPHETPVSATGTGADVSPSGT